MNFAMAARAAAQVAAVQHGWRTDEIWAATQADLRTALGLDAPASGDPGDATLLSELMKAFPDDR